MPAISRFTAAWGNEPFISNKRIPAIGAYSFVCIWLIAIFHTEGQQVVDWAVPQNHYRISVRVECESKRVFCPVGVEIDFERLFKDSAIPGRVDVNSLRVVYYDPETKRSIQYEKEIGEYALFGYP